MGSTTFKSKKCASILHKINPNGSRMIIIIIIPYIYIALFSVLKALYI